MAQRLFCGFPEGYRSAKVPGRLCGKTSALAPRNLDFTLIWYVKNKKLRFHWGKMRASNQWSYILNYLGKQNHIVGCFNYHFGWFYGFALLHTMVFRYFKAATHDRSRDRGLPGNLGVTAATGCHMLWRLPLPFLFQFHHWWGHHHDHHAFLNGFAAGLLYYTHLWCLCHVATSSVVWLVTATDPTRRGLVKIFEIGKWIPCERRVAWLESSLLASK